MICQNCKKEVDNDLVFCTECGARLHETISQTPTVLMNDSVVTRESAPPPKSNLKWFVLLAAFIALPISIFGVYLLLNLRKDPVVTNINKPTKTQTPSTTPKSNTNSNQNVNTNINSTNSNSNINQSNSNINAATPQQLASNIWKERIEIAPGTQYAIPFEMSSEGDIVGTVTALQGSPIEGYVYTQQQFDDHFPDSLYKSFSIEGEKKAKVKQRLIKEKYVLVFVNKSESSLIIDGNFKIVY